MIELYSEILYEILHTVGNDVPSKEDRDILVHYLQEAFNMEEDKHISLLEETKSRTAPTVSLHVKIIEGKDLKPTDPNGLSDPFCIFHLASDSSEHYNTTIKEETLNPVWEENFTLDFDAEESTAEKMKKIKDIKGVKGIKILMKEDESVQWSGRFSAPAETILMQHRVQCGLNSLSVMLAKWIEFINVHLLHPLNFSIFIPLLESLTVALQNNACTDEESLLFWDATKKLLSSCMTGIKRLQIETSYNRTLDQSTHILSILSLVTTLHPPKEVDLLPFTIYDWLPIKDTDTSCDIKAAVKETVLQGSKDWITYALEKNKIYGDVMEEEKLNSLVDLVDQAILSLKSATRSHDKIFQEHFHFPYTKELYKVYAMKLVEIIEPIVTTENEAMKPVTFSEDMIDGSYENGTLKIGTSLFQLYLSLQQFSG
ncbi:hypothetical protein C0J52_20266 [Blattella germanica]|nr:hypothetical protein C0J52_20266 [Blattella germanica]